MRSIRATEEGRNGRTGSLLHSMALALVECSSEENHGSFLDSNYEYQLYMMEVSATSSSCLVVDRF